MKIRTINELQDAIDKEMSWRKVELSAVRSNVNTARNFAKQTAVRAGIALLYAHWEGCIKNIATYYLEYVASLKISYDELSPNFLAIALKKDLSTFVETNKSTIHTSLVNKIFNSKDLKLNIPVNGIIQTKSNLNSEIFEEIMATIGLSSEEYKSSYKFIDEVLLNNRNSIAHGDRVESLRISADRYDEIHSKIMELLQKFSVQISNAASQCLYLRQ